jgi:hypothetical protein
LDCGFAASGTKLPDLAYEDAAVDGRSLNPDLSTWLTAQRCGRLTHESILSPWDGMIDSSIHCEGKGSLLFLGG